MPLCQVANQGNTINNNVNVGAPSEGQQGQTPGSATVNVGNGNTQSNTLNLNQAGFRLYCQNCYSLSAQYCIKKENYATCSMLPSIWCRQLLLAALVALVVAPGAAAHPVIRMLRCAWLCSAGFCSLHWQPWLAVPPFLEWYELMHGYPLNNVLLLGTSNSWWLVLCTPEASDRSGAMHVLLQSISQQNTLTNEVNVTGAPPTGSTTVNVGNNNVQRNWANVTQASRGLVVAPATAAIAVSVGIV